MMQNLDALRPDVARGFRSRRDFIELLDIARRMQSRGAVGYRWAHALVQQKETAVRTALKDALNARVQQRQTHKEEMQRLMYAEACKGRTWPQMVITLEEHEHNRRLKELGLVVEIRKNCASFEKKDMNLEDSMECEEVVRKLGYTFVGLQMRDEVDEGDPHGLDAQMTIEE